MKKLFTFLGKGEYFAIPYTYKDRTYTSNYVQEVLVYIIGKDTIVYVCLTDEARQTNWEKKDKENKGLKDLFDSKKIQYEIINLKEGKNEEEIWDNFNNIYDQIEDGDQIYYDITHSFRSIPIIVSSVLNYARFTKSITMEKIYYGHMEGSGEDGIGTIVDLSLYNDITDWSFAADYFLNTGNAEKLEIILSKIKGKTFKSNLEGLETIKIDSEIAVKLAKPIYEFSDNLKTVRACNLIENSINFRENLNAFKEIESPIFSPLFKILDVIDDFVIPDIRKHKVPQLEDLKDNNLANLNTIIKEDPFDYDFVDSLNYYIELCEKWGLIQQGYTLLRENIINYLMVKDGNDPKDNSNREKYESLLSLPRQKRVELGQNASKSLLDQLRVMFGELGDLRNDINHAGFNKNPIRANNLKKNLPKQRKKFEQIIKENKNTLLIKPKGKKMFLIFSHNLTEEQKTQAKEDWGIKEFMSLERQDQDAWSQIVPWVEDVGPYLDSIKSWLYNNGDEGDLVLVQGDFGATYKIVSYCKDHKLIPVYSTTKRIADEIELENKAIQVKHEFKHVKFRKY